MALKVTTYQKDLIESLKNPREAAAYLNAAMEEGDRVVFLLALRNIAEAHGGIAAIAEKANMNRENLYRIFSRRGNPEIKSVLKILQSIGLNLTVSPKKRSSRSQSKRAA